MLRPSRPPAVAWLALLAVLVGLVGAGCLGPVPSDGGTPSGTPGGSGAPPPPPPSFRELWDSPAASELPGCLVIYFLDTGQSDAVYIRTPGGRVVLVDTGDRDSADELVRFLVEQKGVRRVDLLVLTHPHADHVGGAVAVLTSLEVVCLAEPGFPHPTPLYEEVLTRALALKEAGRLRYVTARAGDRLEPDETVELLVLHPGPELGDDANDASVVLRLRFGSFAALFAGDAGKAAEAAILARGLPVGAAVLKVGHHGSSGSSGAAFLAAVRPEVAVILVGRGNPYGHPSQATLDRLRAAGARVLRTDLDGPAIVWSDGERWDVLTSGGP